MPRLCILLLVPFLATLISGCVAYRHETQMKRVPTEDVFLFCGVPTSLLSEEQGVRLIVKPGVNIPPGVPSDDWDVVIRLAGRVPQIDATVIAIRVPQTGAGSRTVTLYTPRYEVVIVWKSPTVRWRVATVRIYDTM